VGAKTPTQSPEKLALFKKKKKSTVGCWSVKRRLIRQLLMRSGKENRPVVFAGIKPLGRLAELQGRFLSARQFIPHNDVLKKGL